MTKIERLFISGPAGALEGLIEYDPGAAPRFAALVCHPHPLFGGTLHTKAVFRAAKAAIRADVPALRFNFRGVGQSEGTYDSGEGEQADARAALDFLASRYPGTPVLMMGFSFGSAVGMRVGAADARVTALVGMGLPVKSYDYSYLAACPKPKLLVEGTNDEYGPRALVEETVARFAPPKRLHWVEGADHFFTGQLDEVEQTICDFILRLESPREASAPDYS
ncbi:MAG: alpha/beta hydrolase [Terriglobia bacterium]